jgi:hypothetical protein
LRFFIDILFDRQKSAIERRRYELREKAMMEEQTLLHGAKAEAHAEGRTEGKLEGWKESMAMILESKFGADSIERGALLADITDDTRLKRMTPLILAAATTSEVVEIIKEAHTTNLESCKNTTLVVFFILIPKLSPYSSSINILFSQYTFSLSANRLFRMAP